MKFLAEKKTTLFLFLAAIILVSVVVSFYYNTKKVKLNSELVVHTQEALRKSNTVLLDILNIETGLRGFLLSGNPIFLESYNEGSQTINSHLADLASYIFDNPSQRVRVYSLKVAVEKRLAYTKYAIAKQTQNGFSQSGKIQTIEEGKIQTDKVRSIIAAINAEEFNVLQQRRLESARSSDYSQLILMMLLIFIIFIFILVFIIIKNQRIRNIELEAHTASQQLLSNYSLSLLEASLDPLITLNTDGKITDMNEATANITGLTREELNGTDFFTYFTDSDKAREVYKEVFAKGSVADKPLTLRHRNGNLTDVSFNGSVYKDAAANVLGVVIVARDIAEQKWALGLQNANKELAYQNDEKEKRAQELSIANIELAFQNDEKEKRAAELIIANKELIFQNDEKEKRAAELIIANEERIFQGEEKGKRAAELILADKELLYQIKEKEKQEIANFELEAMTDSLKLASQYSLSLIEASRDPLFTINNEGKITDLNEATVRATGVPRKKIIGSDFFTYFSNPDKAREAYKEVFAKGFIADFPLTITDGVKIDVLCNGSVYRDDKGNVLGVVIVARDITEQKRIATELNEAIVFAELAVGIAEEAKIKAESATLIAETAVKAKQQFLSNMSHEIRTPMNAIIGFTKVLLKTDTSTKQKEYLHAIKLSGDALIVLINDILDLAKVDAGKMVFERTPFKMAVSVSAMLHLFEPKIHEKNLELFKEYDTAIPDVLLGDPVRLHQIILNLVSNAVKFTNKGKITVSVRLLKEDDLKATIEFAVKDTGIGIAPNKTEKIFDNFQQASSGTSRLYGGTGLGLAIVKQLVEAQDGTITLESKLNEGSTFGFVLDFLKTKADAALDDTLMDLDSEINNIRVLVVEDIALNQLLMRTLLDEFGFHCEIAANGKIAIEKLQSNHYDVILMDLQMPVMNGFEATDYIRNEMKSSIPIIALTADVTTVDLVKCKAVGMNDYIAKPVDEKLLYSKIVSEFKRTLLIIGNSGNDEKKGNEAQPAEFKVLKYTDLHYLITRTKANPVLMMEMISLYLEQTPPLISLMRKSWKEKDWASLYASVHKIIPSFAIMGINPDYENMARKVQDFAKNQQQSDGISELVIQIDTVCTQACAELEAEYTLIKNSN